MSRPSLIASFTLVELLATIAILAVLVSAALFFTVSYIQYAKLNADKQTYTVLNDALSRYKTQGGGVAGLTADATISRVISQMQMPLTWAGMSHQVLQKGVTYHGTSLGETGSGASYHFSRYGAYNDGSGDASGGGGGGPGTITVTTTGGANAGLYWDATMFYAVPLINQSEIPAVSSIGNAGTDVMSGIGAIPLSGPGNIENSGTWTASVLPGSYIIVLVDSYRNGVIPGTSSPYVVISNATTSISGTPNISGSPPSPNWSFDYLSSQGLGLWITWN